MSNRNGYTMSNNDVSWCGYRAESLTARVWVTTQSCERGILPLVRQLVGAFSTECFSTEISCFMEAEFFQGDVSILTAFSMGRFLSSSDQREEWKTQPLGSQNGHSGTIPCYENICKVLVLFQCRQKIVNSQKLSWNGIVLLQPL